jgi:hypothetical protein
MKDEDVIKRELNRRLIYECRCDERLKSKTEGSTRLALEHLKIETRLIDERFPSVMGECEIVTVKVFPSIFREHGAVVVELNCLFIMNR